MGFNGFISYSHAADGRLAPAIQRGLHRLAKPWHRRRALWIFRDQTGLAVTPALWSSIQKALDSSDFFVLLASPEAARSHWVNREVEHWVATKSADRILPVVTDGEWRWDPALGDFTADSSAVPAALRGVFSEEPLFLDLRWARDDQQLSLRHSRFRDAIAQLAAPMHGVSKDELEGEDVRQHRRAGRLRLAAVAALVGLAFVATLTGVLAVRNAVRANASAVEARSQHAEASVQRDSAARFAEEARRQEGVAREQQARAGQARLEAERQERVARGQKGVARAASAEAARQLRNADRAAARAREQERLALRQTALAKESAREMRRQEQRAKEQERLTREQERLAAEARAEARKQEALAREQERRAAAASAEADRQQRIAIGRRLVNQAKATLDDDPQTARRLGIAAQRIYPEAELRGEVASLVTATRYAGGIGNVSKVAYGPGSLLATINENGTVSLWGVTDRANPVRLTTVGEAGRWARSAAFSRDGQTLAVTWDKEAILWDVADPSRPVQTGALAPGRSYASAVFSPDGRTLVTGDRSSATGYATLWDVTDRAGPKELATLNGGPQTAGSDFGFSADGHTLVVNHDGAVVWDITDRTKPVWRSAIKGADAPLRAIALSPTEPILAIGESTGTLTLVDLSDPAEPRDLATVGHTRGILSMAFGADGRVLASGDAGGTTILWGLDDGYPMEIGRVTGHNYVFSVAVSADSRTLVTADDADVAALWNVSGFAAPARLNTVTSPSPRLTALRYGSDGRSLTVVDGDGTAAFWDITDRAKPVRRATVQILAGALIDAAAISADGHTVAASRLDGAVILTDVTDPNKPSTLATIDPALPSVITLAFSPDGRTLVGRGNSRFLLWDVTDRRHPSRLVSPTSATPVTGPVAFSPDGRTLAVVGVQTVSLWDLTNRAAPTQLSTLVGHGSYVATMMFSPDGRTVATGGFDGVAILWDITDRAKPRRLTTLSGHDETVSALAFSKDGKTVTTVGTGPWAMVWDVAQPGRPIRLAQVKIGTFDLPKAAVFSPDGNTLVIGTEFDDYNVRVGLWDLTDLNVLRADPVKAACVAAGGGLTAEEWAYHIPELSYQPTCPG
jgi:WD40 repeat protein